MHQHAAQLPQGNTRPDATVLKFPRRALYESIADRHLQWFPELGIGYFPVTEAPYDQAYFDRFARQAKTAIGRKLMASRVAFVAKFWKGTLLDVGIGSGAFIELRGATLGYDINPAGREWLENRGLWFDPYEAKSIEAASLWDVLEHIHDPQPFLAKVERWLFLSVPLFRDAEHVLRSKHYRKDEHCWYFTRAGLIKLLREFGFDMVADSNMEEHAGREDIGAFAFKRNGR